MIQCYFFSGSWKGLIVYTTNTNSFSDALATKREIYIRGNPKYVCPSAPIIVRGASAPRSGATKHFFKTLGCENKK